MTYSLFKVVNKQVWLINACPTLNTYICELVPGYYLKKLIEKNLVTEIDPIIILDSLFMFEEITYQIEQSKFFACIELNQALNHQIKHINYLNNILKHKLN